MTELSKATLGELQEAEKAIIYASTTWCGPCKMTKPLIEKAEKEKYAKTIDFFQVDLDQFPEFRDQNNIKGVPTILFVHNGEEVHRIMGGLLYPQLEHAVKTLSER